MSLTSRARTEVLLDRIYYGLVYPGLRTSGGALEALQELRQVLMAHLSESPIEAAPQLDAALGRLKEQVGKLAQLELTLKKMNGDD